MASSSTVWASVHSAEKLSGFALDHAAFDGVDFPYLLHGINDKTEDLSHSYKIATLKTHCIITLKSSPHYAPIRDRSQEDLSMSKSAITWPDAPPCSPKDSMHLQEALLQSYQSLKANVMPQPNKAGSSISSTESSMSLDELDPTEFEDVDLASLADAHWVQSDQGRQFSVRWTPLPNNVLNEALGSFARDDHLTIVHSRLHEAINTGFNVCARIKEDEGWDVVDL